MRIPLTGDWSLTGPQGPRMLSCGGAFRMDRGVSRAKTAVRRRRRGTELVCVGKKGVYFRRAAG